ncbi:helix-turn-helix domain-containing protein [Vibrio pacinii]|uniref:helix-turn-helix domain-containing protein n=1 Tax=Vibrio pacinii TaxID=170674 RepID=UPI00069043D6|nr:AraC family transcriptional regulator [Vibrio pacinii]
MNHTERVSSILEYLEDHCHEELNLEHVAKRASLSPFHFHRIFKSIVGETVAEYVRRLRYEKTAQALLFQDKSVTAIALSFGYSSPQSMAKGFKKYYGVTPSQIKQCKNLGEYAALMQNSKIGSSLHKNRHELPDHLTYADLNNKLNGKSQMKTIRMNARKIAYVRVIGPYGESYDRIIYSLSHEVRVLTVRNCRQILTESDV